MRLPKSTFKNRIYDNLTEMQPWRFLLDFNQEAASNTASEEKRTSEKKFERTKPSKLRKDERSKFLRETAALIWPVLNLNFRPERNAKVLQLDEVEMFF